MLDLYQFELSHYCEKIRFILDYKGLAYRKIDVTPGIGQFDLLRQSGQRQVPVLKDGATVIADSTAIALYLDQTYPDKPILPLNPQQRSQCFILEEWADLCLGLNGRIAMLGAFGQDPALRAAALPDSTPDMLRQAVNAFPTELLNLVGTVVGKSTGLDTQVRQAQVTLDRALEALSLILADRPYLVCDHPTLADFAVAGLSMYIKFPDSDAIDLPRTLRGKGVPGLADNPAYTAFFQWRDRLYSDYRQGNSPAANPRKIQID
jgi:glutathione S-transferase